MFFHHQSRLKCAREHVTMATHMTTRVTLSLAALAVCTERLASSRQSLYVLDFHSAEPLTRREGETRTTESVGRNTVIAMTPPSARYHYEKRSDAVCVFCMARYESVRAGVINGRWRLITVCPLSSTARWAAMTSEWHSNYRQLHLSLPLDLVRR